MTNPSQSGSTLCITVHHEHGTACLRRITRVWRGIQLTVPVAAASSTWTRPLAEIAQHFAPDGKRNRSKSSCSAQPSGLRSESGGGGNRTRVRGRTGQSVYKLRLPFAFARRPVDSRPTAGLAILWSRTSGDWLSFGAEPVSDAATRATGRARGDAPRYGLGSESECVIVIRTCVVFPVVLRGRPGTSACNSAGEPTTSKPGRPRMSSLIVAAALRGKNLVQDARPSHHHSRRLSRRR